MDPVRVVPRAIVTHGHSDHARRGHGSVLATGGTHRIGDARITLYPAGHILGSVQILMEYGGMRAVVSGEYKCVSDPACTEFELIPCDVFITEATFGLPVFRQPPISGEIVKLLKSQGLFPDRCHLIGAYALGKCQRLLAELRLAGYDRPIYLHSALIRLCEAYEEMGVQTADGHFGSCRLGRSDCDNEGNRCR